MITSPAAQSPPQKIRRIVRNVPFALPTQKTPATLESAPKKPLAASRAFSEKPAAAIKHTLTPRRGIVRSRKLRRKARHLTSQLLNRQKSARIRSTPFANKTAIHAQTHNTAPESVCLRRAD